MSMMMPPYAVGLMPPVLPCNRKKKRASRRAVELSPGIPAVTCLEVLREAGLASFMSSLTMDIK